MVVCNGVRDIINHLSFEILSLCLCSLWYHCLLSNCRTIWRCFCFMMVIIGNWQDIPLFQISWANENSTFFVFNTVVFKFYVFSFRTYRVWKTWILKRKFCNDLHHVCLLFVKTQLRCNLFHWEVFSFTKSNFRLN